MATIPLSIKQQISVAELFLKRETDKLQMILNCKYGFKQNGLAIQNSESYKFFELLMGEFTLSMPKYRYALRQLVSPLLTETLSKIITTGQSCQPTIDYDQNYINLELVFISHNFKNLTNLDTKSEKIGLICYIMELEIIKATSNTNQEYNTNYIRLLTDLISFGTEIPLKLHLITRERLELASKALQLLIEKRAEMSTELLRTEEYINNRLKFVRNNFEELEIKYSKELEKI